MSTKAYAAREGLSVNALYAWRGQMRRAQGRDFRTSDASRFVALTIVQDRRRGCVLEAPGRAR
ncbi:MAG: hypothetical protein LBE06_03435 [Azoarcus sp.]|jgi:transposase-like protein|nr:hypothetical protein [Azoarcus sp.]